MPRLPVLLIGLLLFPVVMLPGCSGGGEEAPPLQAVTGTVTFGGKPTQGITVTFIPKGTSGGMAYGTTDAKGHYSLTYRNGEPGVPEGSYAVIFSKLVMPDGSPIPKGKMAADVGAKNVIPPRYRQTTSTPEKASVPAGGGEFDFKIPGP